MQSTEGQWFTCLSRGCESFGCTGVQKRTDLTAALQCPIRILSAHPEESLGDRVAGARADEPALPQICDASPRSSASELPGSTSACNQAQKRGGAPALRRWPSRLDVPEFADGHMVQALASGRKRVVITAPPTEPHHGTAAAQLDHEFRSDTGSDCYVACFRDEVEAARNGYFCRPDRQRLAERTARTEACEIAPIFYNSDARGITTEKHHA